MRDLPFPPPPPKSLNDSLSQLFLELAEVKRVGLVSAMCSAEDRKPLEDVYAHLRHVPYTCSGPFSDSPSSSDGRKHEGGRESGSEEENRPVNTAGYANTDSAALEAAACALGLTAIDSIN